MLRIALFALLFVLVCRPELVSAQNSVSPPATAAPQPSAEPAQSQSIPAELAAAESAIATSDWKTAETKLDSYLAAHPTDARALFDAGYVADAQNRLVDAAALYRRAIAANPNSFEAHLSLGLLLARQKKPDEARPELAAATTLDPGEARPELKARAWRALARIDRATNPGAASNDLLEALKLSPESAEDTLLAAELAEQAGQNDAAEAAYRRALKNNPNSIPANAGLAHLLISRKQYPDAETLLRAALVSAPDDPTLNAQLAAVLAAEDNAEALPLLEKLHAAHPADPAITRMLAEVLAVAGDYAGSDQLYLHLLAANPQDVNLLVAHGQNLVRQARFTEAFTAFDKATQIDPANGDAWSGLAFAAFRTSRADVTLHALTMRSRTLPENPATLFLWAQAYDTLHQKQQAADYYRRFLEAAAGKMPDQEWQARQRIQILTK
ncbi:MAG: tetratricopeptide repeat protein [Terracidiphilus sp.]|nr:tetratricopeptide repeat protein [Terracidiphilus sp.]MDR3798403.1 tetratricopeptide repeat protein [Terracidiphilus sp.]